KRLISDVSPVNRPQLPAGGHEAANFRDLGPPRNFFTKVLSRNPLFSICLNPCPCFFTNLTAPEHLFHGRPIRLNPASIVSAVPVRWYADLREAQHRTVLGLLDIEDGNRVMIRPPPRGPPCLNDFRSWL